MTTLLKTDPKLHYMRYVQYSDTSECWYWCGALRARRGEPDFNKYGTICWKGQNKLAHVMFYIWWNGEIPSGMVVTHTCNNKRCVNPMHLVAKSQRQNVIDACEDGLINFVKGERHHSSKVTKEQVLEMRRLYKEGNIGCVELGRKFGMSSTAARNIITRKAWAHIEEEK